MEKVTIGDFIDKVARQRATPNLSSSLRVAVLEVGAAGTAHE